MRSSSRSSLILSTITVLLFCSVEASASVGSWNGNSNTLQIKQRKTQHHQRGGWWKHTSSVSSSTIRSAASAVLRNAFLQKKQTNILSSLPRGGNASFKRKATIEPSIEDPGSKSMDAILKEYVTKHPTIDSFGDATKHLQSGLSEDEAKALRDIYGPNSIEEPPPPSWFALIAEQFEDKLVRILVGVAVLSALLEYFGGNSSVEHTESLWHRFAEPLVISLLLVVNASVGVWQSKSAGNSIEALKAMQPSVCTVLRKKTEASTTTTSVTEEIADFPAEDLVPGDLIVLKTGDKVPADCRLVKYYKGRRSLSVDETCLTGESLAVEKLLGAEGIARPGYPLQAQKGMVFAGTTVVSGGAIAMVVATSKHTEFGIIQSGVMDAKKDAHEQKTPLAKQLDEFGNQLTGLIGGVCALVWLASVPKMFANGSTVFSSPLEGMVYYAKVAVALGVAAIPEGLPAVITLCLSLGTRRMAQRNVIVRNLPSVETLGCVSVICSDKTGTLTTNEMTVTSLVLLEKPNKFNPDHIVEHIVEGVSYSPVGGIEGIPSRSESKRKIDKASSLLDVMTVASVCNDARIIGHDDDNKKKDITGVTRDFERTGEPTEAALCVLAEKLGKLVTEDGQQTIDSKNSKIASYHVDRLRELHPRSATLEFHRERKSKSNSCCETILLWIGRKSLG